MIRLININDTNKNMVKINQKQQEIIKLMMSGNMWSSSRIHQAMTKTGEDISLVTVKRILSK